MIRVCHVMTADLWAGAEVQLATAASYLAERDDVRLTAVLFNDGRLADRLRGLGVDVAIVDETRHNALQILVFLARFFRSHDVDVVHTHRYKDTVLGAIAARAAGIPHVVRTMHGLREPITGWRSVKMRAYEAVDKMILRRCADRVIAVSNRMAATLLDHDYPAGRVITIHNGIDLRRVRPARPAAEVKRELGLDDCPLVIGTAGRLEAVKGQDTLLRAAKLILERQPRARFLIAGSGPLEQHLKAMTSQLGIDGACHFLGARNDVHDLIAAMDIFVLPSVNEGLPMSMLEALAAGTPVVASAVGGIPEVIRQRHSGLLVPAGDDCALAAACLEIAGDPTLAESLGLEGTRLVEGEFSRDKNGESLVQVYRALHRRRPRTVGALDLAIALLRNAAASIARLMVHAAERREVNRVRRRPAALIDALKAGKSILVVCHGNIIRSPFAAHLLAESLDGRAPVSIASAGLEAMAGRPPHPTALRQAAERRVDLSAHAASRVGSDAVRNSDVIFVMDIPQLLVLRQRFPDARRKTFLLSSLAPETPLEIRDPIDGDDSVFHACFDHIARAVRPVAGVLTQSPQRT